MKPADAVEPFGAQKHVNKSTNSIISVLAHDLIILNLTSVGVFAR